MNHPEDDTFEGSDATAPVSDAPDAAIISPARQAAPPAFVSERAAGLVKSWSTIVQSSTAPEVKSVGKPSGVGGWGRSAATSTSAGALSPRYLPRGM